MKLQKLDFYKFFLQVFFWHKPSILTHFPSSFSFFWSLVTLLTHTFESDCSDFILHYLQSTEGFSEYETYNLAYNVITLSFCVPGFAQFDGELIPFFKRKMQKSSYFGLFCTVLDLFCLVFALFCQKCHQNWMLKEGMGELVCVKTDSVGQICRLC